MSKFATKRTFVEARQFLPAVQVPTDWPKGVTQLNPEETKFEKKQFKFGKSVIYSGDWVIEGHGVPYTDAEFQRVYELA